MKDDRQVGEDGVMEEDGETVQTMRTDKEQREGRRMQACKQTGRKEQDHECRQAGESSTPVTQTKLQGRTCPEGRQEAENRTVKEDRKGLGHERRKADTEQRATCESETHSRNEVDINRVMLLTRTVVSREYRVQPSHSVTCWRERQRNCL